MVETLSSTQMKAYRYQDVRIGLVVLSQCGIKLPTKTSNVDPTGEAVPHRREPPRRGLPHQVRIVPQKTCYVIEIVYTAVLPASRQGYSAAIDLGLSNLMTATSNNPGTKPGNCKWQAVKSYKPIIQ